MGKNPKGEWRFTGMKKRKLFLGLCLSAALLAGCENKESEKELNASNVQELEDEKIGETTVTSYLTGKQVDVSIGRKRPISVMFNNVEKGCPQTGISRAEVVYEAPLAANTTRLIGIMENWRDLDKIGSIRSTRDYYVSFALEFDAIHVHFGQATAYVGDMLNSDLVDNISGAVAGIDRPAANAFFRSDDRKAPHNLYASAEGILKDIEKFGYAEDYAETYYGKFKFAADGEKLDYSQYPDAEVLYPGGKEAGEPNGFSNVGSCFKYNEEDGKYYRYQYGEEHIDDMTGEQLAYDNVIFQYCYGEVRDEEGYLAFECFGSEKSNKSIVFTDGKMIEGTWWRDGDNAAPAKYLDENGKRIKLNQGKTWICIIWLDYADDVVIE